MKHIAGLVLARAGSKSLPKKNIKPLAGCPLLQWVLLPMINCNRFDSVWVSTDDYEIGEIAKSGGAFVFHRDPISSGDDATSWSGVKEFVDKHKEVTTVGLVQCTSPCLHPHHLIKACDLLAEGYDSVFSVTRQHKLRWTEITKAGESTSPANFSSLKRPRRQDWPGELVESGHFYFANVDVINKGLLQGGRCGYVEIPPEMSIEVDTPADWIIAEEIVKIFGYRQLH